MLDQDQTPKPSLKDRLKTHAPALAIGVVVGAYLASGLRPKTTNITVGLDEPGSLLLGPAVIQSIKEHGSAMIEIEPGLLVDLIDWANPINTDK